MIVQYKKDITVTVELNLNEAKWLLLVMRNFHHDRKESMQEEEYRNTLYNILIEAIGSED